ncbi:MAG: hypothetical protein IJO48_00335 [Clostridia bacterium]|nr:hypothetical protein [Clostridia bacterium]
MYDFIKQISNEYGFAETFFVPPAALDTWRKDADAAGLENVALFDDVKSAYIKAKTVVLLIYPYSPFESDERISAYYIASNTAYHAAKEVIAAIKEKGFYAETARIPLRAYFAQNGIGKVSKNGLLRYAHYGSRIILSAIATDAAEPCEFVPKETKVCADDCENCIKACPVNALDGGKIEQRKCMRYYMDDVPYPDFVLQNMEQYMGCEICMHACRENAKLLKRKPTEEEKAAFDAERLAGGDDACARKLVGKNFTKRSKLMYEAKNFLERNN